MTNTGSALIDAGDHVAPSVWRDLSRDWSRWSIAERSLAVLLFGSTPISLLTIAYVLA